MKCSSLAIIVELVTPPIRARGALYHLDGGPPAVGAGMDRTPGGGEIVEEHFLDANGYPLDGPGGDAHVGIHVRYPD